MKGLSFYKNIQRGSNTNNTFQMTSDDNIFFLTCLLWRVKQRMKNEKIAKKSSAYIFQISMVAQLIPKKITMPLRENGLARFPGRRRCIS